MKIIKIEQGTEEWLEFRQGKITGSKIKDIYPKTTPTADIIKNYRIAKGLPVTETGAGGRTKNMTVQAMVEDLLPNEIGELKAGMPKKDEYYRIVAGKAARPITPNDYIDQLEGRKFSMAERGHILEPEAIKALSEKTGKNFVHGENVVWVSEDDEDIMVSPDGYVLREDGLITEACEIKCLDTHRMIRAYDEDAYPEEYHWQIIQYFLVNSDLQKMYFTMYTDVMPGLPLLIFEINREDVQQDIVTMREYINETLKDMRRLTNDIAF